MKFLKDQLFQIQAFMYGWLTFYHQGHEVAKDCKPYMTDLQIRVQNVSIGHQPQSGMLISLTLQTRENFKSSRDDIQALMRKMLEVRQTVRGFTMTHFVVRRRKSNADRTSISTLNRDCVILKELEVRHEYLVI